MVRYAEVELDGLMEDFGGGLLTDLSPVGLGSSRGRGQRLRHVKACDNVLWSPERGFEPRPGSRDTSISTVPQKPTSMGMYYNTAGNAAYIGTDDAAGSGRIYKHTAIADTVQALPFTPTSRRWSFEMANGLLCAAQAGGAQSPIFFTASNPTNTWHSMILPRPSGLSGIETASRMAAAADAAYAGTIFGGYGFDVKAGYLDQLYVIVASVTYTATLTAGTGFTSTTRAADATAKLNAAALASGLVFTVSYSGGKFTVAATGTFELVTNGSYTRNFAAGLGFQMGFAHAAASTYTAEAATAAKRFWFSASGLNVLWKWSDVTNTTCQTVLGFDAVNDGSGGSSFTLGDSDVTETVSYSSVNNKLRFAESGTDRDVVMDPTGASGTPTFNANSAGGSIPPAGAGTNKTYFYRLSYRYTNGRSLSGPVSAGQVVVQASGNYTINLVIPLPASPRSDYIGWTLERTMQNGSAAGPFYQVADGTASAYSDGAADSSLFVESDETLRGEPVPMNGLIYHKGRLFGWYGSNLYVSQPTIGDQATGICNWVGDFYYPVSKDDGDEIQTCVIQGDRLVVFKRSNIYPLEGDDEFSFRLGGGLSPGAGAAGPAAVSSFGATIVFAAGDGRLFTLQGNRVRPFGQNEVADYLAAMDITHDTDIVCANHLGNYFLCWYRKSGDSYNNDVIVHDARKNRWTHFNGWPCAAALSIRNRQDFNGATLLIADPRATAGNSTIAQNPSFAVWYDRRVTIRQIYVQKLSSLGAPLWTANGVVVSGALADNSSVRASVVSDVAGTGCAVAFQSNQVSSGIVDIFIQRFDANGAPQWGSGTRLSVGAANCSGVNVVADAAGNYIVTWVQGGTLFAQKVNSAGAVQWGAGTPITVNTATTVIGFHNQMLADGANGCYVGYIKSGLRISRIDGTGAAPSGWALAGVLAFANWSWAGADPVTFMSITSTGDVWAVGLSGVNTPLVAARITAAGVVAVTTSNLDASGTGTLYTAGIVGDLSGGAIVVWFRATGVWATRLSVTGSKVWTADTMLSGPVGGLSPGNYRLACVKDANGGAIAAWKDSISGVDTQYVARVALDGTQPWAIPLALAANTSAGIVTFYRACTDGGGGIVLYYPKGGPSTTSLDIYAQRIDSTGVLRWTPTGISIAASADDQTATGAAFANAVGSELPDGAAFGYHIWSVMEGSTDFADVNGANGVAITGRVLSHQIDDGEPQYDKDYTYLEAYIVSGTIDVGLRFVTSLGKVAVLQGGSQQTGPRYNSGLHYNDGTRYVTLGTARLEKPLAIGTLGRWYQLELTFSATSPGVIGGWKTHAFGIPSQEHV